MRQPTIVAGPHYSSSLLRDHGPYFCTETIQRSVEVDNILWKYTLDTLWSTLETIYYGVCLSALISTAYHHILYILFIHLPSELVQVNSSEYQVFVTRYYLPQSDEHDPRNG